MEVFTKARAVKLRSHHDKYLIVADNDQETVRQSRNSSSRRAIWIIERVEDKDNLIRIKNWYTSKYLTASDTPFLLGMTGKKAVLTKPEKLTDWTVEWEPIRDGFQVKLKSWCGKFLRANGGTPPWRNSITHDEPHSSATQDWVFWDVEAVELPEKNDVVMDYLSSVSSLSSVSDDVLDAFSDVLGSQPQSPTSVMVAVKSSPRFAIFSTKSPRLNSPKQTKAGLGMDFFHKAKAVRLRSHHDKYLLAEEDEEHVTQDRNGSSKTARWIVEPVPGSDSIIRLKSCYNKYLTASNMPYLLGMTGRKVVQSVPRRLDSSVEWEPVREGNQVKLKTRYGNFLRANGGLPPWRNSVTHDIPHRTATQDWILWDVDIIEIQVKSTSDPVVEHQDSMGFESNSPFSASTRSNNANYSRQESSDSYVSSPPKSEGRTIYCHVADESGEVDDDQVEAYSFTFKGNGVGELTQKLREEIGLENVVVCSRSPLNSKLYPLRLQLPPNNADMHVVVVPSSSKLATEFAKLGLL